MQQHDDTRDLPPPQVRVITEAAEFDRLQPAWTELFSASPQAATPLHFDWLRTWWRIYRSEDAGQQLRVITVWRGHRLIGGLPLYSGTIRPAALRLRTLQFLSTGEAEHEETCPDYLNLLCLPGEEAACIAAVSHAVAELPWETLHLADVPKHSPIVELAQSLAGVGDCDLITRGNCLRANLAGGMTAYLERLAPDRRQKKRRLLREADRQDVRFEIATPGDFPEFFSDLVRLHQIRWERDGKPGCFSAPRFTEFHRSLCERWIPADRAILARLSVGGRAIAVLYGFVAGGKFDYYQSGINCDDSVPLASPGIQAQLLLMRALCERGVETFDFLRGESAYKRRLATDCCPLVSLHVWKKSVRTTICRQTLFVGNHVRRGVKSLLRV